MVGENGNLSGLDRLKERWRRSVDGGVKDGDDSSLHLDTDGVLIDRCFEGRSGDESIVNRLERKFGLGAVPAKRRELYRRLQRAVERHGECVLELISECVAAAVGARRPDHYFCKAITAKLRESGIFVAKGGDASW